MSPYLTFLIVIYILKTKDLYIIYNIINLMKKYDITGVVISKKYREYIKKKCMNLSQFVRNALDQEMEKNPLDKFEQQKLTGKK